MLRPYTATALNPWKLLDEMERTLEQGKRPVQFPLDVVDDGDTLTVTANLPGVTDEHVSVNLERNVLTISAKLETADTDKKYLWRERGAGEFKRVITLPVRLNPDATTAKLEHGVLTVKLAKAAEATARAIRVNGPALEAVQS